jgi:hypothetical protein
MFNGKRFMNKRYIRKSIDYRFGKNENSKGEARHVRRSPEDEA